MIHPATGELLIRDLPHFCLCIHRARGFNCLHSNQKWKWFWARGLCLRENEGRVWMAEVCVNAVGRQLRTKGIGRSTLHVCNDRVRVYITAHCAM